jgi:Zn-dependent M28 family amino/carboxypeptidase
MRWLRFFFFSIGAIFVVVLAGIVWVTVQPWVSAIPSAPPVVDAARLEAHVKKLSEDFYPRSFDQAKNLDAAADYIRDEFRAAGGVVSEQQYDVNGRQFRNIIARFGSAGPDGTAPLTVIGAHYDSHGDLSQGTVPRETHTPGADDNASGIAGLIELARMFGKQAPPRSIELVAYTLEEPPNFRSENMGSMRHAKRLAATGRKVDMMIVLEMIGYFSDAPNSQRYPVPGLGLIYPTQGNFISVIGRIDDREITRHVKAKMSGATDLPVWSMNALPIVQGIDFSDHLSYWAHGISAVMVTDTSFYRTPHYHQAGDVATTLDYKRMAKVVQAVGAVMYSP